MKQTEHSRCQICDEETAVYKGLCEYCLTSDPLDRPPKLTASAKKKVEKSKKNPK